MDLSAEQQAAIERLRENERLTSNLTDNQAAALLSWAEEQIRAGVEEQAVVSAARSANRNGGATTAEVLEAAQAALGQHTQAPGTAAQQIQPGAPAEQQPTRQATPAGQEQTMPAGKRSGERTVPQEQQVAAPQRRSILTRLRRWLRHRRPDSTT